MNETNIPLEIETLEMLCDKMLCDKTLLSIRKNQNDATMLLETTNNPHETVSQIHAILQK